MKYFDNVSIFLLITITVCNCDSTLIFSSREKRQVFPAPNPNINKPCDPRPPLTECPTEITYNFGPTPPGSSAPTECTTATCTDTKKMCCEIPIQPGLTTPPSTSATKKFCIDPIPYGLKPGKCPARGTVGPVWNECVWDSNCRGNQKCCGGGGSCAYYACVNPVK